MAYAYRQGAHERSGRPAAFGRRHAGLLAAIAALCAWEAAGRVFGVPTDLLPTPSRIVMEIWRRRTLLWSNGYLTFLAATVGLLLAGVTALLVGCAGILSAKILAMADRMTRGAAMIPAAAAAPILLVWLGFGMSSRTAVAWSFSVLFVVHGVSAALRRTPAELAEWLRATGAGAFLRIRKVYGPGLLPFLLRDLRRALPLAASGALTAEVIAADEGLGHLMVRGAAAGDVCLLFAALCLAMLFVAAAAAVIRLMEKLAFGRSLAVLPGAHASVLW